MGGLPAWQRVAPLAHGAMAELWWVERGDERGVLKEIRADQANNPAFQALLALETEALQRLSHPALLVLLDSGPGWLVMERAQHDAKTQPPEDAMALAVLLDRVEQALAAVHAAGIVHRDVKAGNVLWTQRGWVLGDFGAARIDGLTDPAPMLGSPQWMSPGRLAGQPATAASDRYALGMLGWELATGGLPYSQRWTELREAVARGLPAFRPRYPVPEGLEGRIRGWLREDGGVSPRSGGTS